MFVQIHRCEEMSDPHTFKGLFEDVSDLFSGLRLGKGDCIISVSVLTETERLMCVFIMLIDSRLQSGLQAGIEVKLNPNITLIDSCQTEETV